MKILGIALGILLIIGGISCVLTPTMTYLTLAWVAGISMAVDAIGNIVTWYAKKKEGMADGWDLAGAIVSLIFGIVLVSSAAAQVLTAVIMADIVALWIIVKGIVRIVAALRIRKVRKALDAQLLGRNWGKVLAMGVLMTACGILCLMDSTILMIAIGIFVGFSIISSGLNLIIFVTAKPGKEK
ncbi:MAG: hypothetical protein HDT27_04225 [Subdoligranulum sp.]|nr:hypothetical protein [Subdoligranulum sp.]